MSTKPDEATNENPSLLDNIILHENDLSEQAKSYFKYHGQILRAFELYWRSILCNEHMTSAGRHAAFSELVELHTNCKRVLNYMTEHSELLSSNLPAFGPLVICGLPRSGSTLLYNLLACDTNCRAPLFTDMCVGIVPPISRSDLVEQKRRMAAVQASMQQSGSFASERDLITAAHPLFPIEEDVHIFRHASFFPFFTIIASDQASESDTWLSDELNKDYIYDYHELFLRMLNSVDAPRSHWLLKSSAHSVYLDTLLHHYPNAALIMTHRRLDELLPSWCGLWSIMSEKYFDKANQVSRNTVTKQSVQFIDKAIECIMEFRSRQNHVFDQSRKNIFDVAYSDLIKQPIAIVRRLYDHFGLRWSDEFEAAMHAWLRDNPQGKQGRHTYSLTDCGFTREEIEKRYADYINMFHCSSSFDTGIVPAVISFCRTPKHLNKFN